MSRHLALAAALVALAAACASSFNVEYDCTQCETCPSCDTFKTHPQCVKDGQAHYDALGSSDAKRLDEAFDSCEEKRACDYVRCMTDQFR